MVIKFQFVEQNSVECPSDFGANLVQHFMRRYSRYSRYRTKSHDKATISHDILRYSRYQTVLLKLEEIIIYLGLFRYTKKLCFGRAFCFLITDSRGRLSLQGYLKRAVQFVKTLLSYLLFGIFMV